MSSLDITTGPEDDVLARLYDSARMFNADIIVRITSDCPLIDPEVVTETVEYFKSNSYDYIYNVPRYPDGMDVEVMSMEALSRTEKMATSKTDREHVCTYMVSHPDNFRCRIMEGAFRKVHLSVDTGDDLAYMRWAFSKLPKDFGFKDVLALTGINEGS
jgi:spore coat polysaccharide biosynthesis protein SpsF